jgi:hypothetical protein
LNYPITNQAQLHRSAVACRYRLKFYDHAVINHSIDMSKVLKERGPSLAVVSSKFLEANNKVVKAIMRRLPGGGGAPYGLMCALASCAGAEALHSRFLCVPSGSV